MISGTISSAGSPVGGHSRHAPTRTRRRAWSNDVDGPTVLLCNGLGTSPYTWPALLRRDCGVRVISWNHRGVGGSARPDDLQRVGVDAFVEDAVAVAVRCSTMRAWTRASSPLTATVLTHSGFMLPGPDNADVRRAVKQFLTTPVGWSMHLAAAAAEHPRVSLRSIRVRTTFVAGKYDILASAHGTHFVQLEHPEPVHDELLDLVARACS